MNRRSFFGMLAGLAAIPALDKLPAASGMWSIRLEAKPITKAWQVNGSRYSGVWAHWKSDNERRVPNG